MRIPKVAKLKFIMKNEAKYEKTDFSVHDGVVKQFFQREK